MMFFVSFDIILLSIVYALSQCRILWNDIMAIVATMLFRDSINHGNVFASDILCHDEIPALDKAKFPEKCKAKETDHLNLMLQHEK